MQQEIVQNSQMQHQNLETENLETGLFCIRCQFFNFTTTEHIINLQHIGRFSCIKVLFLQRIVSYRLCEIDF